MKETALFGFSYPEETDPPDGAKQIEEAVKDVETLLSTIESLLGTVAVPAAPAAGDLIVVNGTNDPVYKAATGDVTNNSAGVFTIGEKKVATAMIQELAVTAARLASEAVESGKIKGEAVTEAKLAALAVATGKLANEAVTTGKIGALQVTEAKLADKAVTARKMKYESMMGRVKGSEDLSSKPTAYTLIPGCKLEITPAVASKMLVTAAFDMSVTKAVEGLFQMFGLVYLDGAAVAALEPCNFIGGVGTFRQTIPLVQELTLTAALHTIELRAKLENTTNITSAVFGKASAFNWQMAAS